MTRKHFIEIATIIRTVNVSDRHREELIEKFSSLCARSNPRFDRQRFRDTATR